MHAYLIIGNDQEMLDKKAESLAKKFEANLFKFPLEKIDDTRELIKFTSFSYTKPISVYLKNIDKATPEAVNAFLKILEEPKKNIRYILSATNEYKILATILSRCQLIRLGKLTKTNETFAINFLQMTTGEKLLYLDKIKKKEEALEFLQKLIYSLHSLLTKEAPKKNITFILKNAQKTFQAINNNGNVLLQLTNFIVNIDKIRFTEVRK